MNDSIFEKLKFLGLSCLYENWDEALKSAAKKKPSYLTFLKTTIEREYEAKVERARLARIKRAKIPELLVMETFPFLKQPKLDKKTVYELYDSLSFIKDKSVLLFIGPTGCGKTGLATAFLAHAINSGCKGLFTSFSDLLDRLQRSEGDMTQSRVISHLVAFDVLLIDELGYRMCNKKQAGLFFEIMSRRHQKTTTIITTQLGFEEWEDFLHDTHLTAALLDRITVNCAVFNMKDCISIRPKKIVYATKKIK